ncbi:ATP-binding protein [Anaeromicropila populeti]|uniref:MinD superfamily P-loop ATPase, contains an inserted ferredoxin domain n=1 Tax=Anaeromicropila populeti TaxID=37658 RepID=A0A1I6K5L2_9FIRM|nr:ATP-binding protein [Anaeromicropila populeti]SFR86477.1 MinD superfamily P-loop ATPase, contains an inserted ferredoxin domain [Anaeromicropila populeti]
MELVVISGKGGTGKTTVVAALSQLAENRVKVDCDVDAPNLYLFYPGTDREQNDFFGGKTTEIKQELCIKCGKCETVCKFGAIKEGIIDSFVCEGCGACTLICPADAITLRDEKTADTFLTEIKNGIVSRATMEVGSDGSGKLVTQLRKNVKNFLKEDLISKENMLSLDKSIIIIDGSPGIGCSVIASITGSDAVLIVTEPTKSGLEDLKRVYELTEHFDTYVMVCINKYDINLDMTYEIEAYAKEKNIYLAGRIPFDKTVMEAINSLKPVTEFSESSAKRALEEMWNRIDTTLRNQN